MTPTHHHPRDLVALKTGFGLLIRAVGGLEAAHAAVGYPTGRLSEAASPRHADRWPRVDHVAELEGIAGAPLLTQHLARLAGCTLLPLPRVDGSAGEALAGVLRGAGELGARTAAALADGTLCDAERRDLSQQLDTLARAVAHAQAVLAPRTETTNG